TEMTPAHIAHLDMRRRYTYSNRRLSGVIPERPSDILGLTAAEALGPEAYAKIGPYLDLAYSGEGSVFEFSLDDSGRRIRAAFTPDFDGAGAVQGVYVLSMDITEEAQARAALAQTHKRELAAQLTSGVAHDFANLLTIILGLQSRMERMPGLPAAAGELIAATTGAARRGGVLLDRIARISGPRELRPVPAQLQTFLAELTTLARATLPENVSFAATAQGLDAPLLLDLGSLQDSLVNLILNARDAIGGQAGAITVGALNIRDTWLEISVADTGPGFTAAALEKALNPFFTTKGGEGSGLGLSMV